MCEGYVCIDYKSQPMENGSFLVPDSTEMFNYLASYVSMKYYEDRVGMHEGTAFRMYNTKKQDTEILFRKAKGRFGQRATSLSKVRNAVLGDRATFAHPSLFKTNVYSVDRFKSW